MDHPALLSGVVTTKDGRIVTCCEAEQHLMLWDANTQELISVPSPSDDYGPAQWITMFPNEDLLATCHQKWIVFWEMEGPSIQVRNRIDPKFIGGSTNGHFKTSACFSPDGKRIVICFEKFKHIVLDVESGERILEPIKFQWIHAAIWSSDGAQLFCGCEDRSVRCVDSSTGELGKPWTGDQLQDQRHHEGVRCLALSPDGKWLAGGSRDETFHSLVLGNSLHVARGATKSQSGVSRGGMMRIGRPSIPSLSYRRCHLMAHRIFLGNPIMISVSPISLHDIDIVPLMRTQE